MQHLDEWHVWSSCWGTRFRVTLIWVVPSHSACCRMIRNCLKAASSKTYEALQHIYIYNIHNVYMWPYSPALGLLKGLTHSMQSKLAVKLLTPNQVQGLKLRSTLLHQIYVENEMPNITGQWPTGGTKSTKVLPPYKHLNLIAKTFLLITSLLSNVKPSPRTISFHLVLLRYLFAVLLHMEYLEFDSRYRTVPRPPYRPRDRPMAIRPLIGHIVQLQDLLLGDHLSQWHGKCWKTMGKSETESPNCEIGASICHLSIMFPSFPHGKHR